MAVTYPPSANDRGDTELLGALLTLAGAVPRSLRGSVFGVAPAGWPNPNTPILNGPPLFYRLDFAAGEARVLTRLGGGLGARVEAGARARGPAWEFRDFGITRLSAKLGARDFSNTALLPVRRPDGGAGLLATYDAGRPHHLDPETLELVAPVSPLRGWRGNLLLSRPFKQVFSTAHPCFDAATGELFALNHGRSLGDLGKRLFQFLGAWVPWFPLSGRSVGEGVDEGVASLRNAASAVASVASRPRSTVASFARLAGGVLRDRAAFAAWFVSFAKMLRDFAARGPLEGESPRDPFTYLLRWREGAEPRRYELRRRGEPVRVLESAHQMALTEDYVIFVDAAFKMELDGITSVPERVPEALVAAYRREVSRPQSSVARFYFVRRDDLDRDDLPSNGHPSFPAKILEATRVDVPGEVVHFHADFASTPEGFATLYPVHQNAMDGAEFVLRGDTRYDGAPLPASVLGSFPASVSCNAVGRHVIDPARERAVSSRVVTDPDRGWALGLTAGPGINTWGHHPARLSELFVYSQGLVPDQLTRLVRDLYDDYPARAAADLERLLAQGGAPAALLRVDLAAPSIVESFVLRDDQQLVSPQFVPDVDGGGAGWVVCNVFSGEGSIAAGFKPREVWIFAADKVSEGPACRLWHPEVDWGYTLHTAWLPEVSPLPREGLTRVEDDLGDWLRDPEVARFYEDHLKGA